MGGYCAGDAIDGISRKRAAVRRRSGGGVLERVAFVQAAPKSISSWPSIVGRGRGGGRGPRPAWASTLAISSRVVIFTKRMGPAQREQTVTSTAKTRAKSHAHGWWDTHSGVGKGSLVGSLAVAASKANPS